MSKKSGTPLIAFHRRCDCTARSACRLTCRLTCHRVLVSAALVTLWVFSCFTPFLAHAERQSAQFAHLTIRDGVLKGYLFDIIQDKRGFMWFATSNGLSRYDGHSVKVYKCDDANPNSLSDTFTSWIIEDRAGCLWIGTDRGLNRFDPETERFTRYLNDPQDPGSLSHNTIRTIYEDRSGFIWVGTLGGGLNRLDPKTGRFTRYLNDPHDPHSLSHNVVRAVCEDRFGNLWVGTVGGGLNRLDSKTGLFIRYLNDPADPNSLSNNVVVNITPDRTGALWIATNLGVNRLDPETGRFTRYQNDPADPDSLSHNAAKYIHADSAGLIWIATLGGGVNRLDPATGRCISYRHDPGDPDSLNSDDIWCLCEDRTGVLWIGSFLSGIDRFNPKGTGFHVFRNNRDDPFSIGGPAAVSAIAADAEGFLWVGTLGGGLNRFDRDKGQFRRYQYDPADPLSLNSDQVRSVCVGASGTIWVGTDDRGVGRLDPGTGRFARYRYDPKNPDSLSSDKIFAVLEDREGMVWVGTFGSGLDRLDPKANRVTHYRYDRADPFSLGNNTVFALYEDAEGTLWVGTYGGGLNRFDKKTGRFIRYQQAPDDPASLSCNNIHTIYEDVSGTLWVGTTNKLNRFDRGKGTFLRYGQEQGLPSDTICSILDDGNGILWGSTFGSLFRLDTRDNSIQNFDAYDLYYDAGFYWNSCYRAEDGRMFFGGANGLIFFSPEDMVADPYPPATAITGLRLFNKPVAAGQAVNGRVVIDKAIVYTQEITLGHKDDIVSFDFAALHYAAPEKNRYAYMLEGFEKEWNQAGNGHSATYTNLPPGRYVFRVKSSNNHGLWDETGASLKITVLPPFWQTWWFRGGVVFTVVFVFLIWHLNRTRLLRKRSRELEETVAQRTRALQEMQEKLLKEERMAALGRVTATVSHEIRNPLGVIRASVYYLRNKLQNIDAHSVRHFDRIDGQVSQCNTIVEELLEYTIGKAPAPLPNDFRLFIEDVIHHTGLLAGVKVIRNIAPDLPKVAFDSGKMRWVAVNLLQNAAQALRDKKDAMPEEAAAAYDPWIQVRAYIRENRFFFGVEDNGLGMDPDTLARATEPLFTSRAQGTGLGLAIVKKIVEGHGGGLVLESQQGYGTTVVVSIPM